nr:ribonuclease H-like domain-containing protein [Tanacetum cinerariifolium]
MRIEKYFLMTDYSLWERLARKNELKARGTLLMALPDKHQLNFNIHKDAKTLMEAIEKRFGGNKETEKIQKTLLKQQYENFTGSSFKSLDLKEQSLDDLFNNLKIYEAEIKSSFSARTSTQNIAFVYSQTTKNTNDPVSAVASVSAASTKILVSALPNVDTLSNAQIDADDLEDMDLKWQMAMLTVRARRFLQRTGRNLRTNGPTSMGFDMSKVECYNGHRKGHFARECRSPKDTKKNGAAEPQRRNVLAETSTSNELVSHCDGVGKKRNQPTMPSWHSPLQALLVLTMRKSQFDVISYKTGLESVEARLLVYQQNETVFEEDIKLLKLEVQLRDNALVVLRQNLTEQEINDLNLKLEKFQTSSKNLKDDFEAEIPHNILSFVQPIKQVKTPKPYVKTIETFIPTVNHKTTILKPKSNGNYNFYEKKMAHTPIRNHVQRGNHQQYATMTLPNPQRHVVPTVVLTKSKLVSITVARPVTVAVPKPPVTRPSQAKTIVTKPHSPPRRTINHSLSPKANTIPPKVTVAKALTVNAVKGKWEWKPKCLIIDHGNPQHALKDKGVIDSGCSRHMTGNITYMSDFEELNGGYVAFGGNSKGGKISSIGKIRTGKLDFDDVYFVKELKFYLFSVSEMCDKKNNVLFTDTKCLVLSLEFKLPDENQVLLRVPKENNMYNVDLKNIVSFGDLTCLFAKAKLNESTLWHRRLGYTNFKTMNKLVKGNLVRGLPIKVFENDHTCVACKKGKQHRASCKTKPVSSINQPLQRKVDEVGYSVSSKAFRVFNSRTRIVQETLHINFLENKPNVAGSGPTWLFDIDTLTKTMNYQPVTAGYQSNPSTGVQELFNIEKAREESAQQYVLFPVWSSGSTNPQNTDDDATIGSKKPEFEERKPESKVHVSPSSNAQTKKHDDKTKREAKGKSPVESSIGYRNLSVEFEDFTDNSINEVNADGSLVPTVGQIFTNSTNTFSVAELEDITYSDDEEDIGA